MRQTTQMTSAIHPAKIWLDAINDNMMTYISRKFLPDRSAVARASSDQG
ncbi:hypothetical protein [Pseudomonas sp. GM78]|nr:hypothetical protein [Pseudomonas sp. GM78]